MQLLTEDSSGHRARGPRAGPRPLVSDLRAGPGTPSRGGRPGRRRVGRPQRRLPPARTAGEGEKKGLKLDPVGSGSADPTPRFLHRPNPRRIVLKFSFRSYGCTFGTF